MNTTVIAFVGGLGPGGICARVAVLAFFSNSLVGLPERVAEIPRKTPEDVFKKVMALSEKAPWLRRGHGVMEPWPQLPPWEGESLHQLPRKSLDILAEIYLFHTVQWLGPISKSHFPHRSMTPGKV